MSTRERFRLAALACGAVLLLAACAPRSAPVSTAPRVRDLTIPAALTAQADDVYVRIVDVGPGLCAVARIPGGHAMVFDAGHWIGQHCISAVRELVPEQVVDLLILSHSDADHLGDAAAVLTENRVLQTILAGEIRETQAWRRLVEALGAEVQEGGSVHNLQSVDLRPGTVATIGDARLILIAGWPRWTEAGPTAAERRNAISIVARLEYRGRSITFTGDTIGRRLNDPDDACKDAEKVMIERHNAAHVPLTTDVLIAAHHGGNNGSSRCFIRAANPAAVVFSAGHQYNHPTTGAASRFLGHGLSLSRVFRTDLGDDEGGFEWPQGRIPGCADPPGDDDVEIVMRSGGWIDVGYMRPSGGCDSRTSHRFDTYTIG